MPERPFFYVLDGHEPRLVNDVEEWARYYDKVDRHVAFTDLGFCTVSTVFLGIDHSFLRSGPPVLFETMVFANKLEELDGMQDRYCTWDEAETGHEAMVALVRTQFWKRA
jgi:hypothetical protein